MFSITNFFTLLLLTLAVITDTASGVQEAQFNRDICQFESIVCNDVDIALKCGVHAHNFCKARSIACDTIERLEKGFGKVFIEVMEFLHKVCDGQYKPYKKFDATPGSSKLQLDVQAGQLPFTLTFAFAGYPQSPSAKGQVKIDMDEKEIYNDLNDDINAEPDKK